MTNHQSLFTSFRCGSLVVNNRIAMAPMTRCFALGGVPGADVAAYYRRRAEGGVGLIITEGTWINHHAASNEENAPRFYGEDALNAWKLVVSETHAAGGKIVPQLWHTGLTRRPQVQNVYAGIEEDLSVKVSPSGYVMPNEKVAEGMGEDEILAIINAYAEGAQTAEALGFDGIEIHGAHGYMVDQFLWKETNKRTDDWGGDVAKRTRFACELVKACRSRVSKNFPIIFRFSQWKLQNYEAKLADTAEMLAQILHPISDAGVDIFHASQRRFWEPEFEGSHLNLAGWAKKITGKPSMTVGSVSLAKEMAESMQSQDEAQIEPIDRLLKRFNDGEFDLVAVGRALLSDAEWANKVKANNMKSIRPFNPVGLAELL